MKKVYQPPFHAVGDRVELTKDILRYPFTITDEFVGYGAPYLMFAWGMTGEVIAHSETMRHHAIVLFEDGRTFSIYMGSLKVVL
jgi:hypothetical protein